MIEINSLPQRLDSNDYDYTHVETLDSALGKIVTAGLGLSGLAYEALFVVYCEQDIRYNTTSLAARLGASRHGVGKATTALENAGLITVKHGRCHLVNILDISKSLHQKGSQNRLPW